MRIFGTILLFLFLTAISQIGGLVLLISFWVSNKLKWKVKYKNVLVFMALYIVCTYLLVPPVARTFGREKIKVTVNVKPTFILTNILNRNYVSPELNSVLKKTEAKLKGTGIQIKYLDANFPFINEFPLLPHLSHDDGRKLDVRLIYLDDEGAISNKKKSVSGYGVFEGPRKGEIDQPRICFNSKYYQYDYPKYLTLGSINKELAYSNRHTRILIQAFLSNREVSAVFVEPHLRARLNINDGRMGYHGCYAVRHDDHVHIQI